MIDTLNIRFERKTADFEWDIQELKSQLESTDIIVNGNKPIGRFKNLLFLGNEHVLSITGSIPKFYFGTNTMNFSWLNLKPALDSLKWEFGFPVEEAQLSRIDVAANIILNNSVKEYFPELISLDYFQRISRHRTSLRFEHNSKRINFLLYDKLQEAKKSKKLIADNPSNLPNSQNLIRLELQLQDKKSISSKLKIKNMKVSDLYKTEVQKELTFMWLKHYKMIYKKAIIKYPKHYKGCRDFDKVGRRLLIEHFGYDSMKDFLKNAVEQGNLSSSDKSKKWKQFKLAISDESGFEYQTHTQELNLKVKQTSVEALKQIYKQENKMSRKIAK